MLISLPSPAQPRSLTLPPFDSCSPPLPHQLPSITWAAPGGAGSNSAYLQTIANQITATDVNAAGGTDVLPNAAPQLADMVGAGAKARAGAGLPGMHHYLR